MVRVSVGSLLGAWRYTSGVVGEPDRPGEGAVEALLLFLIEIGSRVMYREGERF